METEEKQEPVRVLSREEKIFYDGITIEGGDAPGHKTYKIGDYMDNFRIKNYTFSGESIISKVVFGLIAAGVIFFALFIALPIALVILGVILTIWLVLSFFQKR